MSTEAQTLAEILACPIIDRVGSYNVDHVRADFPVLKQSVHGKPLVYLDNAATTQKPQIVIDILERYYSAVNSNVHRGVHLLSQVATDSYEGARSKVRRFINASHDREIVMVRGTTEAINLVAHSFGGQQVGEGDEIVISAMEHHSNIVPWQMLCKQKGATLRIIPMNDQGELLLEEYEGLLNERTKLVGVCHVSNALGTVNLIEEMVGMAHGHGIPVLVDGAQGVPHLKVDVQELDCDFYVFSGHKLYGPTGIGVLYGRSELLEAMPPYEGGGSMIRSVTFEETIYAEVPTRFEAGTPHIAGGIGLGAAIDYLNQLDIEKAAEYEDDLMEYATQALYDVPGLRLIGTAAKKVSVLSFVMEGIHPHDVGTILDQQGVAVRAGHRQ